MVQKEPVLGKKEETGTGPLKKRGGEGKTEKRKKKRGSVFD